MKENEITKYVGKDWDVEHLALTVDAVAPNIFASSGDIFQASWTNNNITIAVDAKGNGMRAINHNGQATLTINISRSSNLWQMILEEANDFRTAMHHITISDDVEILTTTTASLQKLPELSANSNVPDAALVFDCIDLQASPQPNGNEGYNAQG